MPRKSIVKKTLEFAAEYPALAFRRGHVILSAYSLPPGVFMLKEGHVKQYAIAPDGRELIVNIYKAGSFFPMMWAVNGGGNAYFFEAMDAVVVHRVQAEQMLSWLKDTPDVLYDLLSRLYSGMDGLITQLTLNTLSDSRHKVIQALLIAGKRFGEWHENELVIAAYLTQKEIGQLAGTSREEVSRTLSSLKKEGLISIKGKLIVVPQPKLLEDQLI